MFFSFREDISSLFNKMADSRREVLYYLLFILALGLLSYFLPKFLPLMIATIFILPLRFLILVSVQFDRSEYFSFSPIAQNLNNYRFVILTSLFLILASTSVYLGAGWQSFGEFSFLVAGICTLVMAWPEIFYEKNLYYNRWHFLERFCLLLSGLLILINPAFTLLFLLFHKVISSQFSYPSFGSFVQTHIALPFTILLIIGSFSITQLLVGFQPFHPAFLMFAAFSAHYSSCSVEKLKYGVGNYVLRNNPAFLLANAYNSGWLSSIDESTITSALRWSEKLKPLMNILVLTIQFGTVFLLLSSNLAILISILVIIMHLLIFLLAGDLFWRWIGVDISFVIGLSMFTEELAPIFIDRYFMIIFILYVLLGSLWMKPKSIGWLDTPYNEYFEFIGEKADGKKLRINTNIFRPYNDIISQGVTGTLRFLSKEPRLTFSLGDVHDPKIQRDILEVFHSSKDLKDFTEFIQNQGYVYYDKEKVEEFELFLKSFFENHEGSYHSVMRYISAPSDFRMPGFSDRESFENIEDIKELSIFQVSGIWTKEGFKEIRREKVMEINIDEI